MCVGILYTVRFLNSISGSQLKFLFVVWGDVILNFSFKESSAFCRIRGQNVVLYNVFQCFKLSDEYMKLLSTGTSRCRSRDSAYHAKRCIERHFAF